MGTRTARARAGAASGPAVGPEDEIDGAAAPPPDYESSAREICLRQLTARARTRAELAHTLVRRGIPEDVADRVLDRLTEVGLIDDRAVARAVVESQGARGVARRVVAAKLRQRGVNDDDVGTALGEIPAGSDLMAAQALAARRQRQLANLPPEVQVRRLAGQLARRGFSADVVARVIRQTLRGVDPDENT